MSNKNVYCIFDTETVGRKRKLVYDFGLAIRTKKSDILFAKRWLVEEIVNIPMFNELPFYNKKIEEVAKNIIPTSFENIQKEVNAILKEYSVNIIVAYNIGFDFSALKETAEFTNNDIKFFPEELPFIDLWNASCNSFFQQKSFSKIAKKYQWFTETGNYKTGAEIAFRYITGDYHFLESHTALEDVVIEARILQEIIRQKKKTERNMIIGSPWKKVQDKDKQLTIFDILKEKRKEN
jgi:DNA polymerase III epsilon subunit-like protein